MLLCQLIMTRRQKRQDKAIGTVSEEQRGSAFFLDFCGAQEVESVSQKGEIYVHKIQGLVQGQDGWFTKGSDTPDLQEAKTRLVELS